MSKLYIRKNEMSKYDDTYKAIVHMAKAKMILNQHKGNIEEIPPEKLIELARSEMAEIEEAVKNGQNQVHVIEECSDLMNYLVAMSHVAIEKYRNRI